ncbi:Hypothetical predicted protein [Octopus vulgaris]|uniref:Helitron helicase-like domain-containing protein n=1 Tax=Octopus vulgaris TaxID=6645 RepID=A0AA36F8Z6_OCTVU|nr:Hypothetical predicted protein [Octopus vulgaris]
MFYEDYNNVSASEIAADQRETGDNNSRHRATVLRKHEHCFQRISQLNQNYDSMHIVLLFPGGEKIWV